MIGHGPQSSSAWTGGDQDTKQADKSPTEPKLATLFIVTSPQTGRNQTNQPPASIPAAVPTRKEGEPSWPERGGRWRGPGSGRNPASDKEDELATWRKKRAAQRGKHVGEDHGDLAGKGSRGSCREQLTPTAGKGSASSLRPRVHRVRRTVN